MMAKVDSNSVTDGKKFLIEEARNAIVSRLKSSGIEVDGLTDQELVEKIASLTDVLHKSAIKSGTERLQNHLNDYARSEYCFLTDKDFIKRLFDLQIPAVYLQIFRDHDAGLSRSQIWERIRASGIKADKRTLANLLRA